MQKRKNTHQNQGGGFTYQPSKPDPKYPNTKKRIRPMSYWWTHVNVQHTGKYCMQKAWGHKDEATFLHIYLSFAISILIIIVIVFKLNLCFNRKISIVCPILSVYRMMGSGLSIYSETGGAGGQERVSISTDDSKYVWGWYIIRQEASALSKSCFPWTTPFSIITDGWRLPIPLCVLSLFRRQIKRF